MSEPRQNKDENQDFQNRLQATPDLSVLSESNLLGDRDSSTSVTDDELGDLMPAMTHDGSENLPHHRLQSLRDDSIWMMPSLVPTPSQLALVDEFVERWGKAEETIEADADKKPLSPSVYETIHTTMLPVKLPEREKFWDDVARSETREHALRRKRSFYRPREFRTCLDSTSYSSLPPMHHLPLWSRAPLPRRYIRPDDKSLPVIELHGHPPPQNRSLEQLTTHSAAKLRHFYEHGEEQRVVIF